VYLGIANGGNKTHLWWCVGDVHKFESVMQVWLPAKEVTPSTQQSLQRLASTAEQETSNIRDHEPQDTSNQCTICCSSELIINWLR
jgi:hypothetical protein